MEQTYFRKGFGLKKELRPLIDAEYQSALVEQIRSRGYTDTFGDVTVRLAQEFGFCYGVDRAVDYAYETRRVYPDRRIFLMGQIIHNPAVNRRLEEMGIPLLDDPVEEIADLRRNGPWISSLTKRSETIKSSL